MNDRIPFTSSQSSLTGPLLSGTMLAFPQDEDEQLLEKVVDSYLAKADTKHLYESFNKSAEETKALREQLKEKTQSLANLQTSFEKLQLKVDEFSRTNVELKQNHTEVKSSVDKFQGANEELRTVNSDLRSKHLELQIKVDAIQSKYDALKQKYDETHSVVKTFGARLEQIDAQKSTTEKSVSEQQILISQMQLRLALCESNVNDCEHHVGTCEAHKKDCEKFQNLSVRAVEQLEQKFTKLVESALSASRVQGQKQEMAPKLHGGQSEERRERQNTASPSVNEERQDASVDQGPHYIPSVNRKRRAVTHVETQASKKPRTDSISKTKPESKDIPPPRAELPERALRILDHWDAARKRFNLNPERNARRLIWQFIEETEDPEFSEWIQYYLLEQFPKLARRRARRSTDPLRIIALDHNISWEDFKQAFIKVDDLPPFMRNEAI